MQMLANESYALKRHMNEFLPAASFPDGGVWVVADPVGPALAALCEVVLVEGCITRKLSVDTVNKWTPTAPPRCGPIVYESPSNVDTYILGVIKSICGHKRLENKQTNSEPQTSYVCGY